MEETPKKQIQEKQIDETGIKPGEESQYQPEESQDKIHTSDETLDHIEAQIKHLSARLEDIHQKKKKLDANSEEYAVLENQRRVLRKEIIDLGYHHNMTIIERKKQHAKQDASAEQHSKQKDAPVQEKRQEEINETDRNLAEARYNARIREIQVQLAASRLRRSRQIQLEADLIAIRSITPYYWWRYYDRPYYYPLYSDPLFFPLYPYPYRYASPLYYGYPLYL